VKFHEAELRDLALAWAALGLGFAFFILQTSPGSRLLIDPYGTLGSPRFRNIFLASLVTVGTGFLLHELAHKVVAVRFGQVAAFQADYTMLGLAVVSGLAGFFWAAPGAVMHAGRITPRENGLIAVAGPITNLLLAAVFLPFLWFGGIVGDAAQLGVTANCFLAVFNMLPFGPLDGRKVRAWSNVVFVVVIAVSAGATYLAYVRVGLPF
jgi:Zn-dependent protease